MVARKRTTYVVVAVGVLSLLAVTLVGMTWSREWSQFNLHRYGVKVAALTGGREIYLKREVGLFYDRTSFSLNDEPCKGPDDSTDYRLIGTDIGSFPIYYVARTGEVTVYAALAAPTHSHWPIAMRQELLDVGAYGRMELDYKKIGVSKIEITLDELSSCGGVGN